MADGVTIERKPRALTERTRDADLETLHIDITTLGEGDALPTEFRMFTAGKVDTLKGTFLFDDVAARDVMAAYADYGNDLCLDYNHAMVDPFTSPRDQVAAGWFGLEVRDDELWAVNVRWTPAATRQLNDREWRYMSPTFVSTGELRRISRVINCALTNIPATKNLTPIAASQSAISTASDAEGAQPEQEKTTMEKEQRIALCSALGLSADVSNDVLVQRAAALTASAGKAPEGFELTPAGELAAAQARAAAAEVELNASRKTQRDASVNALLDEAIKGGKATPASREQYAALCATDAGFEGVKALFATLTPSPLLEQKGPSGAPPNAHAAGKRAELNASEKAEADRIGVTHASYLAALNEEI